MLQRIVRTTCFCLGCYALMMTAAPLLVPLCWSYEPLGIVAIYSLSLLALFSAVGILCNLRFALTPLSFLIVGLFLTAAIVFRDEAYNFYIPAFLMSSFLGFGFIKGLEREATMLVGSTRERLLASTGVAAPLTYWLCGAFANAPDPRLTVVWVLGLSSLASMMLANGLFATRAFDLSQEWRQRSQKTDRAPL